MNEEDADFKILVTMNGNFPEFALIRGGIRYATLSYLQVLNLGVNCTSALRFVPRPPGK